MTSEDGNPLILDGSVVISNADIQEVRVEPAQFGSYGVFLTLFPAGRERLSHITAANVGERLAVLLDDRVIMVSQIASRVDGDIVLERRFGKGYNQQEALVVARGLAP